MSDAISSYGVQLSMGAVGGAVTAIAELCDLDGPGIETGTEEVTPHDPNGDGGREFIATLVDGGEVTFDINFLPASHTALRTAATDRVKRDFELQWPDAASTTWSFTANVTNLGPTAPVEGKLSASITLKISGIPTFS